MAMMMGLLVRVWGRGKAYKGLILGEIMACKTAKGQLRKAITGDGRETGDNRRQRETGQKEETKTRQKIKGQKELHKRFKDLRKII